MQNVSQLSCVAWCVPDPAPGRPQPVLHNSRISLRLQKVLIRPALPDSRLGCFQISAWQVCPLEGDITSACRRGQGYLQLAFETINLLLQPLLLLPRVQLWIPGTICGRPCQGAVAIVGLDCPAARLRQALSQLLLSLAITGSVNSLSARDSRQIT